MQLLINFDKKIPYLLGLLFIIIYIFLLIKTAWLSDDAYITFRTVDNFINGHGLRWNISERVQCFTHPLWFLLHSIFYFFTREIFFTSLIISIVLSIIVVTLLIVNLSHSIDNKVIIILVLILSKAFLDYSTSGLENPLTNLLLVLYTYFYFNERINKANIFFLSLLFGTLLTNRMDVFLLVIPSFVYYVFKNKSYAYYQFIILGFSPFILWELFSLWYFGYPFPNTAYAKLMHGIPKTEILLEGLKYYKESFLLDPITLTIILLLVTFSFIKRNRILIVYSSGIILYIFYIIWIGGDFMAGRFFTAPLIFSLGMFSKIAFEKKVEYYIVLFIVVAMGGLSIKNSIFKTDYHTNSNSVIDERLYYHKFSNLLDAIRGHEMPNHNWVIQGKQARRDSLEIVDLYSTGFFGYYAGSECYIIDKLGLCDPLLSKLPCENSWRIGHYRRKIPFGYEESQKLGINEIQDPNLSKYYDNVIIITRGSLLSMKRLEVIWKMNTGRLDYLLENYESSSINHD